MSDELKSVAPFYALFIELSDTELKEDDIKGLEQKVCL